MSFTEYADDVPVIHSVRRGGAMRQEVRNPEARYFDVPTTTPQPKLPPEDEAKAIERRLAAAIKPGQERARQARLAAHKQVNYFNIPSESEK
jgi:hypothetical protein